MNIKFRLAGIIFLLLLIIMAGCTKQEPIASFTADNIFIASGEAVKFKDMSINNPLSWEWTFTGGTPASSTEQNPTVTYENAGKYMVGLSVTNGDGADAVQRANYITVSLPPPEAGFSADKRTIDVGGMVNFSDQSTNEPNSWSWLFEGGTPATSTLQNPTVQYLTAGTYTVGLLVSNDIGVDYFQSEAYITVNLPPPEAGFTSDKTTLDAGGIVNFTDQSTNQPASWSWVFEGGTPGTSTLQNPSVQYSTAGTFNVSLLATNASGSDYFENEDYITVTELSGTDLTIENSTYTEIEIQIDGVYKTIPSGGSVVYAGLMGNSVNFTASTSGETSEGTQVGYMIYWDNTIPLDQSTMTRTLLVNSTYYFLFLRNQGTVSFNPIEVGILDLINGFSADRTENILLPNDNIEYSIGYYESRAVSQFNWIQIRAHAPTWYAYWTQGSQFILPDTSNQSIHLYNTGKKSSASTSWQLTGDPENFLYPDYAINPKDK